MAQHELPTRPSCSPSVAARMSTGTSGLTLSCAISAQAEQQEQLRMQRQTPQIMHRNTERVADIVHTISTIHVLTAKSYKFGLCADRSRKTQRERYVQHTQGSKVHEKTQSRRSHQPGSTKLNCAKHTSRQSLSSLMAPSFS